MIQPAGTSSNPEHSFALLMAVQDLDIAIAQHEHKKATLPERGSLEELNQRAKLEQRASGELQAQRNDVAKRVGELEHQSAAVLDRRRALEARLYGARGAAARDLAAIEAEVAQLTARLSELEDQELALLEEQEPLDAALEQSSATLASLAQRYAELTALLTEASGVIDTQLVQLRASRQELASRLPEALARHYEGIRLRLGGIGAARLVGDRCDGCHLSLPSVEVERIKSLPLDAVVTCEQCGRILVRSSLLAD